MSSLSQGPFSTTSVAGLKRLVAADEIKPDERVVCVATGHGLKDTAGVLERMSVQVTETEPTVEAVREALGAMHKERSLQH